VKVKKEGKVVFENGQITDINNFEVEYDNNDNVTPLLLEDYVKNHYIKIEQNTDIMDKTLIDIIWGQLEKHTVVAHKTAGDGQHIYGITGIVDKQEMERAIQNYLLKIKGE
jgi:hypothetical protein